MKMVDEEHKGNKWVHSALLLMVRDPFFFFFNSFRLQLRFSHLFFFFSW